MVKFPLNRSAGVAALILGVAAGCDSLPDTQPEGSAGSSARGGASGAGAGKAGASSGGASGSSSPTGGTGGSAGSTSIAGTGQVNLVLRALLAVSHRLI